MRPNDASASISVAAGITVGLFASLIQSLGLTIQRKSHILDQARPENERKAGFRRPLWVVGFGIFISSNVLGSIFQIASLPVVILAPLGAVSLLWNAFFARLILGDVFSRYMLLGTLLVVAGAVLIGIYGIVPEPTHSLDDLLRLFGRTSFVVYFSLLTLAMTLILIISHIAEWNYNRHQSSDITSSAPLHVDFPLSSPISSMVPITEETPLLSSGKQSPPLSINCYHSRTTTILGVVYASMSGLLSGMCLIFAKSAVELLVLTAAGSNQFLRWESWALVLGLVALALLQLWYLHKSLTFEDPTLVCPLAFCFYNLSSILNGLVYFDQFDELSKKQLGLVIGGIIILLIGVGAVSIQDDTEDGELTGGIVEGDWVVAEAVANSPPLSPRHPRRSASCSVSSQRFVPDYTVDEGILLTPDTRRGSSRRTVSSPSSLPSEVARSALSILTEDSRERHAQELSVQSEYRAEAEASGTTRTRTISSSTHPPLRTPPVSPPRKRNIRRGTSLFPTMNGDGVDGDTASTPNTPLPGFTIGLSPISPGFSLIPRYREPSGTEHEGGGNGSSRISDTGILSAGNVVGPRVRRWSAFKNTVKAFVRKTAQ